MRFRLVTGLVGSHRAWPFVSAVVLMAMLGAVLIPSKSMPPEVLWVRWEHEQQIRLNRAVALSPDEEPIPAEFELSQCSCTGTPDRPSPRAGEQYGDGVVLIRRTAAWRRIVADFGFPVQSSREAWEYDGDSRFDAEVRGERWCRYDLRGPAPVASE